LSALSASVASRGGGTVARGVQDVEGIAEPVVRVRLPGGGRKRLSTSDPQVHAKLKALVDPVSLLVWTTKSTRNRAATLTESGHRVSDRTVAKMLRDLGFGLQANAKVTEGHQYEDRDARSRTASTTSQTTPSG